ncbi:MAG: DUF2079 domain-containing protein [Chthonomonadales bacterium]|nr:DUF2079 domain-containing protein [Chthonomonadales bacterium]
MCLSTVGGPRELSRSAAPTCRRAPTVGVSVLLAGMSAFVVVCSARSLGALHGFAYPGFDLAVFSQASWLIGQGEKPFVTVRGVHILGDHFSAILYLLAPLCRLGRVAASLQMIQCVAVALGAIPVYCLARRATGSSLIALVFGLTYLFNPSVQSFGTREFHPDTLFTPLLLWTWCCLTARRWSGFYASIGLIALVKETAVLAIVPLGVYVAFIDLRRGAATLAVGLAMFLVALGTMQHFSGDAPLPYAEFMYGRYGRTPIAVAWIAATRPDLVTRAAADPQGVDYLRGLAEPLAFAPILAPEVAATAVPHVVANLLGRRPSLRQADMWYSATVVPTCFAAAIMGLARCRRWRVRAATALLLASLLAAALMGSAQGPLAQPRTMALPPPTPGQACEIGRALARIPRGAQVSASTALLPRLSERPRVYNFPSPFYHWCWGTGMEALTQQEGLDMPRWTDREYRDAMDRAPVEWVALRAQPDATIPPEVYEPLVRALLSCSRYGITDVRGGFVLLRRGASHREGIRGLEQETGVQIRSDPDLLAALARLRCQASPREQLPPRVQGTPARRATGGPDRRATRSLAGPTRRRARGFTLIELLTVVGILAVLVGLLLPVLFRAREAARGTACLSSLRQIGSAVLMYLDDHGGAYPMNRLPDSTHAASGCTAADPTYQPEDDLVGTSLNWKRCVLPYLRTRASLRCSSNAYGWEQGGDESNWAYPEPLRLPASYALNGSFFNEAVPACWYGERDLRPRYLAEIDAPASLLLVIESRFRYPDLGGWFLYRRGPAGGEQGPFQSHNGSCNWLFADGHARRLKPQTTCWPPMWTDRYVDRSNACAFLHELAGEYR